MNKTIDISLNFFSDDGDPTIITTLLDCEPTRLFRRGDEKRRKSGVVFGHWRRSGWVLNRKYYDSNDIDSAIIAFLKLPKLSNPTMEKIRNSGYTVCNLYVGLFGFYESTDFWFKAGTLAILSDLQIELGISYYCVPTE